VAAPKQPEHLLPIYRDARLSLGDSRIVRGPLTPRCDASVTGKACAPDFAHRSCEEYGHEFRLYRPKYVGRRAAHSSL
jgi:hypothetical protein